MLSNAPVRTEREIPPGNLSAHLSRLIVDQVFPHLTRAIATAAPAAPLPDVRDAALVLLYRLLFVLYAEDRRFLPAGDPRYDAVSLRHLGDDINAHRDRGEAFSAVAVRYWTAFDRLCRAIDAGDPAIGLAPCGGGLFEVQRTLLLAQISLSDAVMADVFDALLFDQTPEGPKPIDYCDLSVQQLGGIYEQLLELELVRDGTAIVIRPDISARRTSGSYYTPDDLVALIIRETVGPLVAEKMEAYRSKAEELAREPLTRSRPEGDCLAALQRLDPAVRLLELKICDPAMGAGHFLVSLIDFLADHVIAAMADAESLAIWCGYVSPLRARIERVRHTIIHEAGEQGFAIDRARLDDRQIVRRMAAARCIYGVDKNPMAVELAKIALRLHAFIPGAPLYLDHHLRCGDSLFGLSVRAAIDKAAALGAPLLLQEPVTRAMDAAEAMRAIDELNDAGIAAARRPAGVFAAVQAMTAPLDALLSLLYAFDWLDVGKEDKTALLDVEAPRFAGLLQRAKQLIAEERLFNWEVAFPDVWPGPVGWAKAAVARQFEHSVGPAVPTIGAAVGTAGHAPCPDGDVTAAFAHPTGSDIPSGGFDAVIGNPPWDRMKLQQVEWFAARRRDIAFTPRAADRARMIAALTASGDPLARDYARANARAETAARMAQASGDYPLLSGGDVNRYSLFVERAMALVKPRGLVGLLTPSGIASDKTAAPFFQGVATHGRLKALYDFENRRRRFGKEPFFPDVDSRFKFCVFVASPAPLATPALCASFLQDVSELADAERCFPLTAENFARVNPNTGTAPVFRTRRDADLTMGIYGRLPVLVDRSAATDAEIRFAAAANSSPPPCGEGKGVGVGRCGTAMPYCATPHPFPPPQGGRESNVAVTDRSLALMGKSPATTPREVAAWPVRYMTMFHMTNDSRLFRTKAELVATENAHAASGNRWLSERGVWLPLYEGKMVQAFDHRAASVAVNLQNRHRPAQPEVATRAQHEDPAWLPEPQYWVEASRCGWSPDEKWALGFKEITSPTNERTFVAALFPVAAFGNKIPLLRVTREHRRSRLRFAGADSVGGEPLNCHPPRKRGIQYSAGPEISGSPAFAGDDSREIGDSCAHLLCANLNSIVFDFVVRQKIQGQTLNRFIVEQLPVIPPDHYGRRFGGISAAQIVTDAVLELTYTSHDMAPFAEDMGFTDAAGAVKPPFVWDEERRAVLRAKLDAVYFHLYGVTGRDDIRYIYSTFPIVKRNETTRYGRYLSRDLCLEWMDALAAGLRRVGTGGRGAADSAQLFFRLCPRGPPVRFA